MVFVGGNSPSDDAMQVEPTQEQQPTAPPPPLSAQLPADPYVQALLDENFRQLAELDVLRTLRGSGTAPQPRERGLGMAPLGDLSLCLSVSLPPVRLSVRFLLLSSLILLFSPTGPGRLWFLLGRGAVVVAVSVCGHPCIGVWLCGRWVGVCPKGSLLVRI